MSNGWMVIAAYWSGGNVEMKTGDRPGERTCG
jgi:hypothetical protein